MVFTMLHRMQGGLVTIKLSVCLSICQMHAHILIPRERSFSLILWQEEWLVEGDPFYLKFWVKLTPLEREHRFSISICS